MSDLVITPNCWFPDVATHFLCVFNVANLFKVARYQFLLKNKCIIFRYQRDPTFTDTIHTK